MTAGGVASVARWLFLLIDKAIYTFIENVALIFSLLSRGTIFTQEDINSVTTRVYMLVALIMLFRLAFSFVNYIINPDQLTDSQKGGGKLIFKVVFALALLVLTPTLFNEAYHLQALIIDQDIIGKLVTGETFTGNNASFGKQLSYNTFRTFYKISDSVYAQYCPGTTTSAKCTAKIDDLKPTSMIGTAFATGDSKGDLNSIMKLTFLTDQIVIKGPYTTVNTDQIEYIIDYQFGLSTLTGVVVAYLMVCFCFEVAVRMIKLGFLQLIAPIPIVMSLAPGQDKKDTISTWGRECFSTYISLFIRLMIIYLAFFVIQMMVSTTGHGVIDVVEGTNTTGWQGMLLNLFAIIGALLFAKEAPKLIESLFGLSGSGKITLNPLKKLRETPVVGGAVIGAGAAAGGMLGAAATGAWGAGRRIAAGWNTERGQLIGGETSELMGARLGAAGHGFVNHTFAGLAGNGKGASKGVNALYNENRNNIMKEYKPMYASEESRRIGEKYYNQAEAYKGAGGSASQIFDNKDVAAAFDQANAAKDMMNNAKSAYQQAYDAFNNTDKTGVPDGVINAEVARLDQMRIAAGKAEGAYSDAKKELDAQLKMDPESAKIYEAYSSADARHSVNDKISKFSGGSSASTTPASSGLSGGSSRPTSLRDTH